jgi:acetyl-CoA synthetase
MKPGAASLPFFGIALELMDEKGQPVKGNDVKGVLCVSQPWPGMVSNLLFLPLYRHTATQSVFD